LHISYVAFYKAHIIGLGSSSRCSCGDLLYSVFNVLRMGGIIPPLARDLHKKHVEKIIDLALERASVSAAVRFELCHYDVLTKFPPYG